MTIPTEPPPTADEAEADATASALDSEQGAAPETPPAPPVPPVPPIAAPQNTDRFFLWVAGLGVARSDGWLGGVAAGIAARLRIDPLIVRGVLVVAALFGLPVIFLYALAWALLPDADGRTHTRDLLRRDYQPVQLGILAMAIIGLIPTAPITGTVFGLGYAGWSALSLLSWIVGLLVVATLLFLIVRAASRTPGDSAPDLPMASADPATPGAPVTLSDSGTAEGAGATSPEFAADLPAAPIMPRPEPPAAPGSNDPESLAAWRIQHAAWKEQDQSWRRQQQDAERVVRDRVRAERQAEAAVFATEAAERRRVRRASNPRASFAYVAAVIGLAIVVGAAVGLWSGLGAAAGAVGTLAAALVLALGMIVAGVWRRRSGFLAFAAMLTLLGGLIAGGAASVQQLNFGWASITNYGSTTMTQPFGELYMNLTQHDGAPRPIDVTKGTGSTRIDVLPGVRLDLRATVDTASVSWVRIDEDTAEIIDSGNWSPERAGSTRRVVAQAMAEGTSVTTVQPVTITQGGGDILVTIIEPSEDQR